MHGHDEKPLLYTKCQSSCILASHWTRAYHVKFDMNGRYYFYPSMNNKTLSNGEKVIIELSRFFFVFYLISPTLDIKGLNCRLLVISLRLVSFILF